jgi:hypothetical protein
MLSTGERVVRGRTVVSSQSMTPNKLTLLQLRTAAWVRFLQHRLAANVLAKTCWVQASNVHRGAIFGTTPTRPCTGEFPSR